MEKSIKINPFDYPTYTCPKCGGKIWIQGVMFKKVPGLAIGAGADDQYIDLPLYYCKDCGEVMPPYVEMYKLDEGEKKESNSPLILS